MKKHAPHAPGPRPKTWWKQNTSYSGYRLSLYRGLINRLNGVVTSAPIFARDSQPVQHPVNSNSKDRKGYRRHPLGGIIKS